MNQQMHKQISSKLVRQYDRKVMSNLARGLYVEGMIAEYIGATWLFETGDEWSAWDLEFYGLKIQVKQSAVIQTWHQKSEKRTRSPRFDIKPSTGIWTESGDWIDSEGRHADIYIFAWHSEDRWEVVDQRDPSQWSFFAIPTSRLPDQKTIGLSFLKKKRAICADIRTARIH